MAREKKRAKKPPEDTQRADGPKGGNTELLGLNESIRKAAEVRAEHDRVLAVCRFTWRIHDQIGYTLESLWLSGVLDESKDLAGRRNSFASLIRHLATLLAPYPGGDGLRRFVVPASAAYGGEVFRELLAETCDRLRKRDSIEAVDKFLGEQLPQIEDALFKSTEMPDEDDALISPLCFGPKPTPESNAFSKTVRAFEKFIRAIQGGFVCHEWTDRDGIKWKFFEWIALRARSNASAETAQPTSVNEPSAAAEPATHHSAAPPTDNAEAAVDAAVTPSPSNTDPADSTLESPRSDGPPKPIENPLPSIDSKWLAHADEVMLSQWHEILSELKVPRATAGDMENSRRQIQRYLKSYGGPVVERLGKPHCDRGALRAWWRWIHTDDGRSPEDHRKSRKYLEDFHHRVEEGFHSRKESEERG